MRDVRNTLIIIILTIGIILIVLNFKPISSENTDDDIITLTKECPEDAKLCSDKITAVSRSPIRNCTFKLCPGEIECNDNKLCPKNHKCIYDNKYSYNSGICEKIIDESVELTNLQKRCTDSGFISSIIRNDNNDKIYVCIFDYSYCEITSYYKGLCEIGNNLIECDHIDTLKEGLYDGKKLILQKKCS